MALSHSALLDFDPYFYNSGNMDNKTDQTTLDTFAALSQATRLDAFRLLVRHEPEGLPAGEIARQLEVPNNTLSAHLSVLSRAELDTQRRESRSVIYRANLAHMLSTVQFLVRDCCDASPEVCHPLLASLAPACCPTDEE